MSQQKAPPNTCRKGLFFHGVDKIEKLFLFATSSASSTASATTCLPTAIVGVIATLFCIVVINTLLTLEEIAIESHFTKTFTEGNAETSVVHEIYLFLGKYIAWGITT